MQDPHRLYGYSVFLELLNGMAGLLGVITLSFVPQDLWLSRHFIQVKHLLLELHLARLSTGIH